MKGLFKKENIKKTIIAIVVLLIAIISIVLVVIKKTSGDSQDAYLKLSSTSGELHMGGLLQVPIISNSMDLSCSTDDIEIAYCDIEDSKLIIQPGNKTGFATIYVNDLKSDKVAIYEVEVKGVILELSNSFGTAYKEGDSVIELIMGYNYGNLSCTSDDLSIATCAIDDNKLIVTPGSVEGKTIITVMEDNSYVSVEYVINVEKPSSASVELKLSNTIGSSVVNGSSITTEIEGSNYGRLTCTSSDESVATCEIKDNILTVIPGSKVGTAAITVKESKVDKTVIYQMTTTAKPITTLTLAKTSGTAVINSGSISVRINASNHGTITCTTSNSLIATCSISGNYLKITPGSKVGTTTITIKEAKEGKTATYKLTTTAKLVVSLSLSETSGQSVVEGANKTATINASNHGALSCTSTDESIAKCNITGTTLIVIPGSKVGTATITVKEAKEGKTATYKLTTIKRVITLNLALTSGQSEVNGPEKKVLISGSNYGKLECSSNNESVATCSFLGNYLIITPGSSVGTATITVKELIENKTVTYKLTTIPKVEVTLSLASTSGTFYIGDTAKTIRINANNNGTLTCSSSNLSVATCSVSGTTLTVTPGTTAGTATITVKEDKQNKTVTYTATVKKKEVTLSLNPTSGKTVVGGSKLTVQIQGSNYGELECGTGDTSIATCSIAGNILTITPGTKVGTTNILVTEKKENKTATFKITVEAKTTVTLSLTPTSGESVIGGNKINVTVSGNNFGTLTCTSSNLSVATCSVSGTTLTVTPGTTAGTTTITVKEGKEGKTATYTIIVKKPTLTLGATKGETVIEKSNLTTTISYNGFGKLECISNKTDIATCTVSGTTLIITPKSTAGTATITVKDPSSGVSTTYTATIKPYVYTATTTYKCSNGTPSGSSCILTKNSESYRYCSSGTENSYGTCDVTRYEEPINETIYDCDNYPGYTLDGTKCKKEITTPKITNTKYTCPTGYAPTGEVTSSTVCSKEVDASYTATGEDTCSGTGGYKCTNWSTTSTSHHHCIVENGSACSSGYTYQGGQCVANQMSYTIGQCTSCVPTCPSGTIQKGSACYKVATASCPSGYDVFTGNGIEADNSDIGKCIKYVSPNTEYSCPNGGTLSGTTCNKTDTVTTLPDSKTTSSCPSDYSENSNGECVKTDIKNANSSIKRCERGTYNGYMCVYSYTTNDKITAYRCPSGYTPTGNVTSTTTCTKTEPATPSYTCPEGGTLSGTTCTKG